MPIFEYQCRKCGEKFEQIVLREGVEVKCPKCGASRTERLLSGFAVSGGSRKSAGACGPSGST